MKPLADLSDAALAKLADRSVQALPDAPPWLVESAIGLWRAPSAAPGLGQRIAAVLGFDSWAMRPTLAFRSASLDTRQLMFFAGDCDVDVRVGPVVGSTGMYVLSGQLLGPGASPVVSLALGGAEHSVATPDEFGEFRLGPLPAGRYTLTLQVADDRIELPEIDVGGEAPP